jgi:hypothetical protein
VICALKNSCDCCQTIQILNSLFAGFIRTEKKMEARSCLRDSSARIARVRARYSNHAPQSFECFVPFGLQQDESGNGSDDENDEEDAVGVDVRGGNVAAPPAAIDNPFVVVVLTPAASARGFGLTPRPSIGKKRAKQLAQQAAAANKLKKTKNNDPPEPEPDKVLSFNQVLKHRQNESLERLAFAAEAKANVAKEQYMFNFHTKKPCVCCFDCLICGKGARVCPCSSNGNKNNWYQWWR